ncbi:MAG: 3,5-nucleoside bisphosphate phosphatase [Thermosipho sp. (in: thermotogales)]|nr:3,5-nucleoside bisphosphate phosphatase [Thermosipho sp. (in: thermotogales)]
MKVDFHVHSTASDGTYAPDELIEMAKNENIEVISITDHDTIDGIKTLKVKEIKFIPGLEISAEFPSTLHILGYGFDVNDENLNKALDMLKKYRLERNKIILEKIQRHGFNITMEELIEEAKGKHIGRPHFASLLVKKGYVESLKEAFEKYLKKGALFYENKKRLNMDESIELISNAGGIAVMAHPYQTNLEGEELEKLVKKLVSYGLKGIEVYYSKHTPQMIEEYERLAEKYNLVKTAGSDFHGKNTPDIKLGMEVEKEKIERFLEALNLE